MVRMLLRLKMLLLHLPTDLPYHRMLLPYHRMLFPYLPILLLHPQTHLHLRLPTSILHFRTHKMDLPVLETGSDLREMQAALP